MKKRRYHTTRISRTPWDKIAESIGQRRLTLAVDVAKEIFYAALMTEDREVHATIKWTHPQETRSLSEQLSRFLKQGIDAILEPSGTYGDSLQYYLQEIGCTLYSISPKRVHDAAEIYDGVPSLHDAKAAYLIGRLHLEGISSPWIKPSTERRDQHALVAELDLYQSERRRNLSRLEALLSRHWPEIDQIIEIQRATLLHLLAEYGSPQQICNHKESAYLLAKKVGRAIRHSRIQAIIDSSEQTLGVPCTESECHYIQVLAHELLHYHDHLLELDKRITRYIDADPELQSIATVTGKTTSLVLRSTLGSAQSYPNARAYLKATGLNLKERSSGKQEGRLKITKRGSGKARFYLYFTAMRMTQRDPVVRAWYQKKVQRDGDKPRYNALVAVMRKLVLALWHVASGEAFDSSKLFNTKTLGLN